MIERVRRMLVKEFLQMLRDPRMRMVVLVMPVVQMVVIAFALTTDVHDIGLGVLDGDGTPSSRALIRGFTAAGWFHVIRDGSADRDLERWLDRGEVRVVMADEGIRRPAGGGVEVDPSLLRGCSSRES
jgi:ABC-2 type transport system permease protein